MCTVLIADDELITVKNLFNSLIEKNKDIHLIGITSNGKEVLEYMKKEQVDILLLDLMMPEMSRIEVLDTLILQKEEYLSKTKIIVISSYLEKLYDENKYREYIYAILPKPYNVDKLLEMIKTISSESENENAINYIKEELSKFNFNKKTIGYKYLMESIYEIISRNQSNFELENDIYKIVAKINDRKPIQIKWTIDKMINKMFVNTKYNIIQNYFEFNEFQKPTTKSLIQHIISKYYEQNNKKYA